MKQRKFESLPRHRQTEVYFEHENNQTIGKNGRMGPSLKAQGAFVNDWQKAFYDFADTLPR